MPPDPQLQAAAKLGFTFHAHDSEADLFYYVGPGRFKLHLDRQAVRLDEIAAHVLAQGQARERERLLGLLKPAAIVLHQALHAEELGLELPAPEAA